MVIWTSNHLNQCKLNQYCLNQYYFNQWHLNRWSSEPVQTEPVLLEPLLFQPVTIWTRTSSHLNQWSFEPVTIWTNANWTSTIQVQTESVLPQCTTSTSDHLNLCYLNQWPSEHFFLEKCVNFLTHASSNPICSPTAAPVAHCGTAHQTQ